MESDFLADDASQPASGSALYDEEYYESHCARNHPYRKGDPEWEAFYAKVADNIVRSLGPETAYDAGCAIGFLVEALWDRGVETHGRDISEFAIQQVRPDVRDYCEVGSVTDRIEGVFDLVLCIEVLEHLTPDDAAMAIKRLVSATNQILFSSTPTDFDEPTHVNVRPPIYWIRQFAAHGFAPVLGYDGTFVCPHALLFRKTAGPVGDEVQLAAAELVRLRTSLAGETTNRLRLNTRLAEALEQKYQLEVASEELRWAREAAQYERGVAERIQATQELEIEELRSSLRDHHERLVRAEGVELRLQSIEGSVFWRATAPLRKLVNLVPAGLRTLLKRLTRRIVFLLSLRFLRQPTAPTASAVPSVTDGSVHAPVPLEVAAPTQLSEQRFPYLEPLRVFKAPDGAPTVNVVTDSILAGSLFGGVATALILASQIATRLHARLRLITRTEPADAAHIVKVLQQSGVPADLEIETLLVADRSATAVPLTAQDYFLTTSWWTTAPTLASVGHGRVAYLLQEDERMFYPMGDEFLRCAEVLNDPELHTVINSEMLLRHFSQGPGALRGLAERAACFEPAFPTHLFYEDPAARAQSGKRNFLFYARPNNVRNLYWRGLDAIERAILEGTLDPEQWRFVFLGKDIHDVQLPGNPELVVGENLPWDEYAGHVRAAHVGLSLIYSPHPSYPPLDLAASGAVVVTNTFETSKTDLGSYSKNILCVPPTVADLNQGIVQAVALAGDDLRRLDNAAHAGIARDWSTTLAAAVDQIVAWWTPRS